ncbi:hypothetical protein BDV18DRAFT_157712 [Aspergillus unguis]
MDFHLIPRGEDRNYTGFLTKTIVYSGSLIVFIAAFALSLASIIVPNWVSYHSTSSTPGSKDYHYTYGLHRRCSSLTDTCDSFPKKEDCLGEDRYFCSMWRTVGFMMSFAVVLEAMSVVAWIIIISGSKRMRENGWKVLVVLILIGAGIQIGAVGIVAYLVDNEERFFIGWRLDMSWIFCTVSWCVSLVTAGALIFAAHTLPSEGGYELIPDSNPDY